MENRNWEGGGVCGWVGVGGGVGIGRSNFSVAVNLLVILYFYSVGPDICAPSLVSHECLSVPHRHIYLSVENEVSV